MENRKPSFNELKLIEFLIERASVKILNDWKSQLTVKPENDEGMGSLLLSTNDFIDKKRMFGKQISDCSFFDKDGVKVIASLYVDQDNELYELELWKVDYSSVLEISEPFNFNA